jgi:hypothetical protein
MSTTQNLQAVKDELDFLIELLATNCLGSEQRTKLLRHVRVLLVEMDALASTALDENKQPTVDIPVTSHKDSCAPKKTADPLEESAV